MLAPRLTEAMRRATIEVFVQQHLRPDRHPERAFGDQPWGGRGRDDPCDLRARAPLTVALALDTTNVGLDFDFDDVGRFGTRKRHKRFAAGGAAFGLFASIIHCRHYRQGAPIATTMSLTAGLLSPMFWAVHLGRGRSVCTRCFL